MLYELTDEQVAWIKQADYFLHTEGMPTWTLGESHAVRMAIKESLDHPLESISTD